MWRKSTIAATLASKPRFRWCVAEKINLVGFGDVCGVKVEASKLYKKLSKIEGIKQNLPDERK